jgi:hypothetical protein
MKLLKVDITFDCETESLDTLTPESHLHMGLKCCNLIRMKIQDYPEGLI